MKKYMFTAVILLFTLSLLTAQELSVKKTVELTKMEDGAFYSPQISPDGKKVFFSGANYNGLYYLSLDDQEIVKLTDEPGAGYETAVSEDGRQVFYRSYEYVNNRKYSSLVALDVETLQRTVYESAKRDLSRAQALPDGKIVYKADRKLKEITPSSSLQKTTDAETAAVFIEKRKIVLYQNDQRRTLEPFGPQIYIWPSLSPDGSRLLFTVAGRGTFVSDLDGNVLAELGYANAPQWSPDGQWIVFMDDQDDGHVLTGSEIGIIRADGTNRKLLTESAAKIELYPKWGIDNKTIVFGLDHGQIVLMELTAE